MTEREQVEKIAKVFESFGFAVSEYGVQAVGPDGHVYLKLRARPETFDAFLPPQGLTPTDGHIEVAAIEGMRAYTPHYDSTVYSPDEVVDIVKRAVRRLTEKGGTAE